MLSFFSWNLGTTLQKTCTGMLRAIVHSILERRPDLIQSTLPNLYKNWKPSYTESEPTYNELKQAFENLRDVAEHLRLGVFIDGIDEFDENHHDLSQFLCLIPSPRIKLVISSRPINATLNAF